METKPLKRIGHGIRWGLEAGFIWFLVFPETGIFTGIALTCITVGIEFDHLNPRDWSKN